MARTRKHTRKLKEVVSSLLKAFQDNSRDRTAHPFPSLITGSGMGKTRFGYQAPIMIEEVLKKNGLSLDQHIFIDVNGGGDRLTQEDLEAGPDFAMAIRLLARGLFGVAVDVFRETLHSIFPKQSHVQAMCFFNKFSLFSFTHSSWAIWNSSICSVISVINRWP